MDPWDITAGQLILKEARRHAHRVRRPYPHRTTDRADVVASNGRIHAELLTALKGHDRP